VSTRNAPSNQFEMQAAKPAPRSRAIAFSLGVLVVTLVSVAAEAQEVAATSRSAGMGEAMTAGVSGTSALWHNPAGISSAIMYSAEAGYYYDSQSGTNGVTANVIDTKSNPDLGAGLAFTYETASPKDGPGYEAYHVKGGFAIPLVDGLVKMGGGVRYTTASLDGKNVVEALTADAGIMVQPLESLSIGVAGLNLVNGGYEEEMPSLLSIGLALGSLRYGFYLGGDVLFNLSAEVPEEARTWRAGAEYLAGEAFPLRAGFQYDELVDEKTVTVGAGFRDSATAIGFDASYQHNLDNKAERVFIGSLSAYF